MYQLEVAARIPGDNIQVLRRAAPQGVYLDVQPQAAWYPVLVGPF